MQGWPKEICECPLPVRPYWNFRDILSIVDGVIVKGTHIVIPMKFQPGLLSLLHDDSHLGIDKCIQHAKGAVYWPNISEDIKTMVNKCEKLCCQMSLNMPIINLVSLKVPLVVTSDQCKTSSLVSGCHLLS